MEIDKLRLFLDKKDTVLGSPFSIGEYTFATDRKILVRVPKLPDVSYVVDDFFKDRILELFQKAYNNFVDLPPIPPPTYEVCPECSIFKTNDCPECYGEGEVFFENTFNEYCFKCQTCDGKGDVGVCDVCEGDGKLIESATIKIGHLRFSDYYLRLLQELPNVKIAIGDKFGPNYFVFDGGDGFLMSTYKSKFYV